jgi:DNA-binding beta-propeller fold protein YncE
LTIRSAGLLFLLSASGAALTPWQGPRLDGPAPARRLADPFPSFNGMALDPAHDVVFFSDTNLKSLMAYGHQAAGEPLRTIRGADTDIGFVAGVAVDPAAREVFAVNNDIEDTMVVFSYDDQGNARPRRRLAVPHQAWGVALEPKRGELAVSVQGFNSIMVYRRQADALEPPLRSIRGNETQLADPHGVEWDAANGELVVANHGNFRGFARNIGAGCVPTTPHEVADTARVGDRRGFQGGRERDLAGARSAPLRSEDQHSGPGFRPPSLNFYGADAKGNAKPLRLVEGPKTRLDWPMGIAVDAGRNEVFVANNGDSSVLVFRRGEGGDVAPVRVLRGPRTGIDRPMAVAVDAERDELWVANFGNHTAVVFPRSGEGDVAPKRTIRNAPAGAPTVGFGNPQALAYDSQRDELLVPN